MPLLPVATKALHRPALLGIVALLVLTTACSGARQAQAKDPEALTLKESWEKNNGISSASGDTSREHDIKQGLDARLTTYTYPFPVALHLTKAQDIPLEMAYMDVPPEPGQPERGTVLLLHGKNFSGAYWERTIHMLTAQGFRVIAPDQIGFGKSSKPTNLQYTFQQLTQLTHELVAKLGVKRLHVVGHSMGGMIATRYALMYPKQTESLTLVNPIGLEDWKRVVPYRDISQWEQAEAKRSPEDVKNYMKNAYFAGSWEPAYDPLLKLQAGWVVGPDRKLMAKISALTYDMIFTQPVLYEFPDVRVPTLLIIGQRDRTALGKQDVAPEVAATLGDYPTLGRITRDAIPNARLVELEGVGHIPHYEDFARFEAALLPFLTDPSAAPAP